MSHSRCINERCVSLRLGSLVLFYRVLSKQLKYLLLLRDKVGGFRAVNRPQGIFEVECLSYLHKSERRTLMTC